MSNSLLLLMCLLAQSENSPGKKGNVEPSPLELFKQEAAAYSIQLNDRTGSKLVLDPSPLLHWDNPARTAEDGAVFVWLKDGRPEVIGSIFTYKIQTVRRKHEFHSLSTSPLTAEFKGKVAWKPRQAGVQFQQFPDAPVPADNARLRLVQMKALARDFSATIKSLEGEPSELRLLPQPLYRYEPKGGDVLDGSLFSIALGTDPEVFLLIEARREKPNDDWRWQYALVRFNYGDLTASFRGKSVWHVAADPEQTNLSIGDTKHFEKSYISFHVN